MKNSIIPRDLTKLMGMLFEFESNPIFVPKIQLEKGIKIVLQKVGEQDAWKISICIDISEIEREFRRKIYPIGIIELCKKFKYRESGGLTYSKEISLDDAAIEAKKIREFLDTL